MDANGLRFWMLSRSSDWLDLNDAEFEPSHGTLRLASTRLIPAPADRAAARAQALTQLGRVRQARDEFGTRARWDAARRAIVTHSALPGTPAVFTPPAGQTPTDFAVGHDGVLYVAVAGRIRMRDLRDRWTFDTSVEHDVEATAAGFSAWRIAPDPAGGVWVLDRDRRLLARVTGQPFPDRPPPAYAATTFRPEVENPNAPRLRLAGAPAAQPGETWQALAVSPGGRVALLAWRDGGGAQLYVTQAGRFLDAKTLAGASFPYSLTWLSDTRVALRIAGSVNEAPAYDVDEGDTRLEVVGDLYPLQHQQDRTALPRHVPGPFLHGVSLPPHYPIQRAATAEEIAAGFDADQPVDDSAPLHRVSLPAYRTRGEARNFQVGPDTVLDSGAGDTEWHRLYLEARLPAGCGAIVWLAATDTRNAPAAPRLAEADAPDGLWHPHLFGGAPAPAGFGAAPRAAWVSLPSEIPHHSGLLHCPPERDRAGLFTALIQRATRPVKVLRGRYLWVRVQLYGDGRSTPQLAALRAYGSRFSYVRRYLPELYRESQFGPEGDEPSANPRPTPADFLERFVGNFEGVLTALEDRIAAAYVLTHPASTPDDALPWLATWIGADLAPGLPAQRQRQWLLAALALHQRHGTLGGLRLALELGTGGEVLRVPLGALRASATADTDAEQVRLPAVGELLLVDADAPALRARNPQGASGVVNSLLLAAGSATATGEVQVVLGGAVSGGEIVVVEDFRLRRVVATILGANFAGEPDPLLPGLTVNSNSLVGDTLMLGEESRKAFLALYRADLEVSEGEAEATAELYDRLAHRVTVLVHQDVAPSDLSLIRSLAAQHAPAHVEVRVIAARYPFLVGIASLIGVDSYLAPEPPRRPVRIDESAIGQRDFVQQAAALDPRVAGAPGAA